MSTKNTNRKMSQLSLELATLSVIEPWDFRAFCGQSTLKGQILRFYSDQSLLFRSDVALTIEGVRVYHVLSRARYVGRSFFDQKDDESHVNGAVILDQLLKNPLEAYSDEVLEKHSKFILMDPVNNS